MDTLRDFELWHSDSHPNFLHANGEPLREGWYYQWEPDVPIGPFPTLEAAAVSADADLRSFAPWPEPTYEP